MIGFFLVDRPGLDCLRQKLVDAVGGLEILSLLTSLAELKPFGYLHLETGCVCGRRRGEESDINTKVSEEGIPVSILPTHRTLITKQNGKVFEK